MIKYPSSIAFLKVNIHIDMLIICRPILFKS